MHYIKYIDVPITSQGPMDLAYIGPLAYEMWFLNSIALRRILWKS